MVRAAGGWLMIRPRAEKQGNQMSRTTRTIAAATIAAVASLGVITAAPAHAAVADVHETVNAAWTVVGELAGAPGNVHSGNLNIFSSTLDDGSPYVSPWVSATDWQCPEGVTSPDTGECTWLRGTASQGSDPAGLVAMSRGLDSASVTSTIAGYWSLGSGETIYEDFHVDVDYVGTGTLTRDTRREAWADGTMHVVTEEQRSGTLTGTVAGISLVDIPADVIRRTYR